MLAVDRILKGPGGLAHYNNKTPIAKNSDSVKWGQNKPKRRKIQTFSKQTMDICIQRQQNRAIFSTKPRVRKFHRIAKTDNRHNESNVASTMETGLRVAVQMIIHVKALPPLEQNS